MVIIINIHFLFFGGEKIKEIIKFLDVPEKHINNIFCNNNLLLHVLKYTAIERRMIYLAKLLIPLQINFSFFYNDFILSPVKSDFLLTGLYKKIDIISYLKNNENMDQFVNLTFGNYCPQDIKSRLEIKDIIIKYLTEQKVRLTEFSYIRKDDLFNKYFDNIYLEKTDDENYRLLNNFENKRKNYNIYPDINHKLIEFFEKYNLDKKFKSRVNTVDIFYKNYDMLDEYFKKIEYQKDVKL